MASRLLLVAIASAMALLSSTATSKDDNKILQPWAPDCSTADNYTAGSQYKRNLDKLLAALPEAAGDNGWFYEGSAGAGPDEVFGLIMCYADYNATACLDCLDRAAAGITTFCPGSRSVRAMYDACTLQYSATPIPSTADLAVLYRLTGGVAASPLRLANSTTPYTDSWTMYGLAQCTRVLNASECSRCVSGYAEILFPNNTGGVIKGYSCYLRYQVGYLDITMPPPTVAAALPAPGPSSSSKTGIIIFVCVGSILFLAFLVASSMWLLRRRRRKAKLLEEAMAIDDEFDEETGPKQFRYGELVTATDIFSDKQKLGEGGFGSVYRGYIKEIDRHVAIKQGRKEYASEVTIISRLRHRNLVQLIGWCHDSGDLLLVYELMPNGSLDTHLYGNMALPWPLRHKIVLGIGSALLYLHQDWEQCVLHRDIKPSNVMLDASFNAKLGDFGLARLVDHGSRLHTTVLAGTMGYMDPECMITGRADIKSDVYSFGVLLLEIACGRRPPVARTQHGDEDGEHDVVHIVQWVWEFYGRGNVKGEFDAREMETMMVVGLWCAHPDRSLTPSIRQAVNVLWREAPRPSLPARMPVATFLSPPNALYYTSSVATSGRSTASAPDNTVVSNCFLKFLDIC
ncbi:unnamed protein product [Urochloa decumbens]|uniref:Uncharacterized protein n=1 Tax=Urochloa decumbens TaxID=240449 RepID=A0ABC8VXQ2_9POAL